MTKKRLTHVILAIECVGLTLWYSRYILLRVVSAIWIIAYYLWDGWCTRGMACIGALLIILLGYDLLIRDGGRRV